MQKKLEKLKKKTKKAAEKKKKKWYEPKINSNVYVKGRISIWACLMTRRSA